MFEVKLKKKAYILGAGLAGLVTAWKLLENNYAVEIFEKDNVVGGMCRTWRWNEFLVDTGPHIYHTPDAQLADFWEKEFSDLFVKGDFWCKNVRGKYFDEYWDYPLSWESISQYPENLKKIILKELGALSEEDKAKATNYTEYMNAQVGPTLQKMFFKTYPKKIWGIDTCEMTPDWAPKRVEFRQKRTPFYHKQWNAVGKYGAGCICERIADKIQQLGGIIHLSTPAKNIVADNNVLKSIALDNHEDICLLPDDVVISSLPITVTAKFLGYESKLFFRGICSVYLEYKRKNILPKNIHWLYYGDEDICFNRVTEPKKMSSYLSPKDKTYLTVETTYSKNDEIDKLSSEEFIEMVAAQIEKVGLARKSEVIASSLNKEDNVYPVHYIGYQEELAKTRAVLNQYRNLYSVGTGGDYNYADAQVLFHKAFDLVSILTDKHSKETQVIRMTPKCKLNSKVSLGNSLVGDGQKTYIIAEAGINNNGSLKLAKKLVDAAMKAGCNAVKFQTFTADSRISNKVKGVNYVEKVIGLEETASEMFNRLAMPFKQQKELFIYARKRGIEIFSTPFDFESVDFLESLNVSMYKISSMDLVNLPLIERVAKTDKPIILSTGMSTLGQIEEAVSVVTQSGNSNLILLHCNSSAAPAEMNLQAINTLKKAFNVPVGLSDHTLGLFVSHTALVLGANVIERHFTLDRMMEGPDHILSSESDEMAKLVDMANKIPIILGDGVKKIQPNEYDTLNAQRKSLYASRSIKQGQIITSDMLVIKGPGGGLLPRYLDIVIGRTARVDIEGDYPITWELI